MYSHGQILEVGRELLYFIAKWHKSTEQMDGKCHISIVVFQVLVLTKLF